MNFEMTIEVSEDDLDDLNHVNNVRYVQWIQDISKAHWESRASEKLKSEVIWVVKQHLIRYKSAAKMGDCILLKTFIKNSEGAISTRVVEMFDQKTKTPLLQSETEWCLLNADTLKPMRISEEIRSIFIKKS